MNEIYSEEYVEAYRSGFADALQWALDHLDLDDEDRERVEGILES